MDQDWSRYEPPKEQYSKRPPQFGARQVQNYCNSSWNGQ